MPISCPSGRTKNSMLKSLATLRGKFNRAFGETFKLPEHLIMKEVETIPGIDGRKMSKSYDNTIPLLPKMMKQEKSSCPSLPTQRGGRAERPVQVQHFCFTQIIQSINRTLKKSKKIRDGRHQLQGIKKNCLPKTSYLSCGR